MKLLHPTLALSALAPSALALRQDYMYYPSVTHEPGAAAAPTCVVHANDIPCRNRNTVPEQLHNVSSFNQPLIPARRPLYPSQGTHCYNMQHGSNPNPDFWHDSNMCGDTFECPSVPKTAMWVMDDSCSAYRRGVFKAIMAFTLKDCEGEVTVWDMGSMKKDAGVVRQDGGYCMMMENRDGGPKIGSFQFLTEALQ